jgi:hypothetical protein
MEVGHAALVIVKPMDVERAGMAGANLPALTGASRGISLIVSASQRCSMAVTF